MILYMSAWQASYIIYIICKGGGGSLFKLFTCTETKDYATRFMKYTELNNGHFRINKERKEVS